QRTANIIRPLACNFDQMNRDLGGKRQAVGLSVSHRKVPPLLAGEIGPPICTDGGAASKRCRPLPRPKFHPPKAGWHAPAWPTQPQRLAAATGRRVLDAAWQLPTQSVGALPWEHPCSRNLIFVSLVSGL